MRADTRTISIDAPPDEVVSFLEDPRNLPRWAVGFARAVHETPAGWVVRTGSGDLGIRIEADRSAGTVDFWSSPAPGVEVRAASRVVARGTGSEFVLTHFQEPGMSHETFEKNGQAITHELAVLKALLEVKCPL